MQMILGGKKIFFFELTVSQTVYATLSATPFDKPINPGMELMIPLKSTGIYQTSIRYNLNLETELYLLHTNMEKSLKQKLMGQI